MLYHDARTSFRAEIDDSAELIRHLHHFTPLSTLGGQGGEIVGMTQLLVMMVELTSETWYELVINALSDCGVL